MKAGRAENLSLIALMLILGAWFVWRIDWLVGLAFVPAAPFIWFNMKRKLGAVRD